MRPRPLVYKMSQGHFGDKRCGGGAARSSRNPDLPAPSAVAKPTAGRRCSTAVVQGFCKAKVGSSILSTGIPSVLMGALIR